MTTKQTAGYVRLYNMHETQAFLGTWNGIEYIHQPIRGVYEKVVEKIPNERSPRKFSQRTVLKLKEGTAEKKNKNWIDVPAAYAHEVTSSGLGVGRLQPSAKDDDTLDHLHHGGFLKTQPQVDRDLEAAHAEAERDLAKKQKAIEVLEQRLAALEHQVGAKSAEAAKGLESLGEDLKKKRS